MLRPGASPFVPAADVELLIQTEAGERVELQPAERDARVTALAAPYGAA